MTRLCWAMCLMSAAGSSEICVDKDPMICQQLDPSACQDAWFAGNCCGSCSGARNSATLCEMDIDISAIISGTYFLIPVRSVLHPKDLAAGWCAEHPELESRHCLAEASKAIGEVCTLVFRAPDSPSETAAAPGCGRSPSCAHTSLSRVSRRRLQLWTMKSAPSCIGHTMPQSLYAPHRPAPAPHFGRGVLHCSFSPHLLAMPTAQHPPCSAATAHLKA